MGLRAWHVVVCLLLGFFLAATSARPVVREGADHMNDIFKTKSA